MCQDSGRRGVCLDLRKYPAPRRATTLKNFENQQGARRRVAYSVVFYLKTICGEFVDFFPPRVSPGARIVVISRGFCQQRNDCGSQSLENKDFSSCGFQ